MANRKKFFKELKHLKTGKRVRTLKKHLARDYEWKMVRHSFPKSANSSYNEIRNFKHISIDGAIVMEDIMYVCYIMLADKKEELTEYLIHNDEGLRKFAELRYKELEDGIK